MMRCGDGVPEDKAHGILGISMNIDLGASRKLTIMEEKVKKLNKGAEFSCIVGSVNVRQNGVIRRLRFDWTA